MGRQSRLGKVGGVHSADSPQTRESEGLTLDKGSVSAVR